MTDLSHLILLDDAERLVRRHGWTPSRDGDQLRLKKYTHTATLTAALLIDVSREAEGILTVARKPLKDLMGETSDL